MRKIFLFFIQLIGSFYVYAQNNGNDPAAYNPHDFFLSDFNPPAGNDYRSANGAPGPKYWQNNSSYVIHVTLSEKDTTLLGDVEITYTNNSPNRLDYLWLQLDENIFAPSSRGIAASPVNKDAFGIRGNNKGGYHIKGVTVTYHGCTYAVEPVVTDTRMQLRLEQPLLAKGDTITVKVDYGFVVPENGAERFGRLDTKTGVLYQIAQWFPRMCVYDDVEGWNTLPYLGQGEFYCDYGDYEYYITVPAEMLVYGSGDLQNAAQVLTPEQAKRLASAANSDETVTIITKDDLGKPAARPAAANGTRTWHYSMKKTRDVAFAAGKGMIWDAARINLPSGRKAMAMSVYPPESIGDTAWSRSTEYLKHCIEIYSEHFFEYPWNTAVSVGGLADGMEYPGIIFNNYKRTKARLWFLISHEIGHNWYPMIVGSNERKYMWLDEGLNTYMNYRANELFNNKEYLTDASYLKKGFFASLDYTEFMFYRDPLMTVSDAMDIDQHYQYYGKAAYGLNLLRDVVVGKERFDYAFRKYTEDWAFKHPTPYDFFRSINNGVGEDLNWFWKGWFFTTWKLDQAVREVNYVDNDPAKGALISIDSKGKLIMPVIVKITQIDGHAETLKLPVEIWQRGGTWTFTYASQTEIEEVILDPEQVLPDVDRTNNHLTIR